MSSTKDFPKESIDKARHIAEIYRKREKSKLSLASNLYDRNFLEFNYGFSEALRMGNCGPYLHEIEKESECMAGAAALYLVARELNLNPKLYWAVNMKQIEEGETEIDEGLMDHSFITIPIGKEEHAIDPFMSGWGTIKFSPNENKCTIHNKSKNKIITRTYEALIEMSQNEIINQLEELRSASGGRLSLQGSEKINSCRNKVFVTFNPEKRLLSTKLSYNLIHPSNEPYKKSDIYKLETKVNNDGTFNFSDGNFISYFAGEWGWSHHIDEQESFVIPTVMAESFWVLCDEIMKKNLETKNIHKLGSRRLNIYLRNLGLEYGMRIKPSSIAENVYENLSDINLQSLQKHQLKSVKNYLERAREDEISWKVFLRDAQYNKAREGKKSQENPNRYVFSKNQHEELFLNLFEGEQRRMETFIERFTEALRIDAGLKSGTKFNAHRIRNEGSKRYEKESTFFNRLVDERKIVKDKEAFSLTADQTLFFQQYDIANDTRSNLEKGLTFKDLILAGKFNLFEALLVGATRRKSLYAKKFHYGLRKILNQTPQ